jgi:release factor H-coupled RctB family protein
MIGPSLPQEVCHVSATIINNLFRQHTQTWRKNILSSNTKLFASPGAWIEQRALDQLAAVSALADVMLAAGYPDLHAGKGTPIGVAVATRNTLYPLLIGNDVGCGMGLFATDLETRSFKLERAWRLLDRHRVFADIAVDGLAAADQDDPALGTIGGGNHFAEFTRVESIDEPDVFASLGLESGRLCILVHSGSRGHGEAILRRAIGELGAQNGFAPESEAGRWYLDEHGRAVSWAAENRSLIARRCLAALGVKDSARRAIDVVHNGLARYEGPEGPLWVHRKGAAAADSGPLIIPGSRGTFSYLVLPVKCDADSLYSVAHGAGRKWQRKATAGKLGDKYTVESIRRTALGGRVLCRDQALLFEEASEAYKNIDRVIADLVAFGLVRVVARFRPILTLKY